MTNSEAFQTICDHQELIIGMEANVKKGYWVESSQAVAQELHTEVVKIKAELAVRGVFVV